MVIKSKKRTVHLGGVDLEHSYDYIEQQKTYELKAGEVIVLNVKGENDTLMQYTVPEGKTAKLRVQILGAEEDTK